MLLKMITRPEFLLSPSISYHSVEADKMVRDDAERYIRLFIDEQYDQLPVVKTRDTM